jgi:antitoxin (DNA-binding transcriptional repressor) of toxin-antitoxin stability system
VSEAPTRLPLCAKCVFSSFVTATLTDLRRGQVDLLAALHRGEAVELTNHGRLVGRVIPAAEADALPAAAAAARRERWPAERARILAARAASGWQPGPPLDDTLLRQPEGDL